ncbi:MAG: hypothetical protein ABW219_07870 [Ilumatobacteraceae bacterium]
MGFRDRFWTPTTARAIVSWRLLLGVGAGVLLGVVGVPVVVAAVVGLGLYAGSVLLAVPRAPKRATIDAFSVGEPWRHFVQGGQRSKRQLTETIRATKTGPLRDRLQDIADRLDEGLAEGWAVAKRGDQVDKAIRALDPTRLRSRLETLRAQAAAAPTENLGAAVTSVESQLASADRLKELSASTADNLRLTQSRLDELVARAAEVSIGASDTDRFAHDVDDLVLELESLHEAVRELPG